MITSMRILLGLAVLASLCLTLAFAMESSANSPSKNVLVLLPGQPGTPFTVDYLQGMRKTYNRNGNITVNIYSEHLNLQQFPNPEYESQLIQWLATKYSAVKFDAIIPVARDSLEFTEKWRDILWPGTPVIFSVVDETGREEFPSGFTGTNFWQDYLGTVRAALQLQPETRHLALVSGSSKADRFNRIYALNQLKSLQQKLEIIEIHGLSFTETEKRLSTLPKNTIVLVSSFFVDGTGQLILLPECLPKFSAASNCPVYELTRHAFGLGSVGGVLNDYEEAGAETARLVTRVLNGESTSSIPVQQTQTARLMFDWRQLRRWGLDESRLPAGSIVMFRTPTFWQEYKWHISAAIGLIILQSLLIAALLTERTMRRKAQESEQKTTELSYSVLNSVQDQVGIINTEGVVVSINESWFRFRPDKTMVLMGTPVGDNYIENCKRVATKDEGVQKALIGIQSVLNGTLNHFSMEHFYHLPAGDKWFEMSVEPLKTTEGGVVISHGDITEKRIAEIEAQEHRRELAHVSRATAMGELASSLAHELNQPLTAILSNAQAASRIMVSDPSNLAEVKEVLNDIVSDDIRAGEIIHRMRAFLKKEEIYFAKISLNDVVKDVVRLTRNEALNRKVNLDSQLSDSLPPIRGDSVQLQQVMLNLVMNALESSSQQHQGRRFVDIFTKFEDSEVQLLVCDSGSGIQPEQLSQIFEPFFTTKKEGLGMGLSICRSIVKEHGGRIWAESEYGNGASFYCAFPAVESKNVLHVTS
jgi:signal transduction histidine kinase/ABC-type uncharacterized transport system substrate-binding protein